MIEIKNSYHKIEWGLNKSKKKENEVGKCRTNLEYDGHVRAS